MDSYTVKPTKQLTKQIALDTKTIDIDPTDTKTIDIDIDIDTIENSINITLIKKKLQILYTYSTTYDKDFKTLLLECAEWDTDCNYVVQHTSICNLYKYIT
tara:strand:+ start:75 stop:377 length:303 start_codon:yes stop_codon:yes gene_type:complete